MKRLFNIRIITLTVMLLMGAITVTSAEPLQFIGRPIQVERPFAAMGSGPATPILDGSGNPIGSTFTSSGRGNLLGLWIAKGEIYATPDPVDPNILHETGTATFIAENGDQLNVVLRDGITNIATTFSQGSLQFAGGTGRYVNATGSVNFVVGHDFLTGAFEMTIVGTIRY